MMEIMNGRQIFEHYGSAINLICSIIGFLPKSFRKWLYVHARNVNGRGGIFLRYILLSRLAKRIGRNVKVDPGVIINNIEQLSIGDNVSINPYCFLIASGGIKIGSNVSIAHHTSIVSETHTWDDENTPISYNPLVATPITIDDDVWVGCGVRIIGPCHIPSRTIIAAGAVVKGNLEPFNIYAGIPAKVIKRINNHV